MNFIDYFDQGWRIAPENICLKYEGAELTYNQMRDYSLKIANGLRSLGCGVGFHGAIFSGNKPMGLAAVLGLLRAGGVWSPVNPRNAVAENTSFLQTSECEVLIYHSDFADQVQQLRSKLGTVKHCVCIDQPMSGDPCLQQWLESFPAEVVALPFEPDRISAIAGTGGTTGKPKGVCITNRVFQTYMANMMACMEFDQDSTYLAAAPITHAAGVIPFPVFAKGGKVLLHNGIDPQKILHDIQAEKVSLIYLPPTATYALLAQPNVREFDYSSLRNFVSTSAPISAEKLREAAEVFGPVMTQLYGQTECMMIISYMGPEMLFTEDGRLRSEKLLRSCGRPAPFNSVSIVNEQGGPVLIGERGEVVVQSDMVMPGYYKNPEVTAETLRDGRLFTGDVGMFDEDGFLYIVDRCKDMIISGGFNIYPIEIEQVIWSHPSVEDCAVIGTPDEKWGESVTAVVQLKAGKEVSEEELVGLCKEQLGSVKTPKQVIFTEQLPRSPVGKVLKKVLREQYWKDVDRTI